MREINRIIVHHSASQHGDAEVIDHWHRHREPPFSQIGYHYVVLNGYRMPGHYNTADDGLVEPGRDIETQGAHARGHNTDSIGVCLIGKRLFSPKQLHASMVLINNLRKEFNISLLQVLGHGEVGNTRCPSFNMLLFRDMLGRL